MTSHAPTNMGSHVTSNIACVRGQRYRKKLSLLIGFNDVVRYNSVFVVLMVYRSHNHYYVKWFSFVCPPGIGLHTDNAFRFIFMDFQFSPKLSWTKMQFCYFLKGVGSLATKDGPTCIFQKNYTIKCFTHIFLTTYILLRKQNHFNHISNTGVFILFSVSHHDRRTEWLPRTRNTRTVCTV